MNSTSVITENYEKLMPVVERLYQHTDHIAQIALLPLFLLSVAMAYSQDLGIEGAILRRLKRLVFTALLLALFPSATGLIKNLGQEVALSIDNMHGIEEYLKAAAAKASTYSSSLQSLLDFGNDLVVSLLVTLSYVFLYMARYLLVAFYHFYWMVLVVTGPLLILGNLFDSTASLTRNLFRNLTLVAFWPVVWAILSAFLTALPFEDAYAMEGGYTAVVVLNLILAVALLFSPFLLSQFCEGSIIGTGSGIVSTGARAATAFLGGKAAAVATKTGEKAYPVVKKYMPSSTTLYKASSKLSSKLKLVLFFLISTNASASNSTINIQRGLSTVLCFEKAPSSVAIGDGRYFQAQKLGRNLILRSLAPAQKSNMLVFRSQVLVAAYDLSSNPILPHTQSLDCKKLEVKKLPVKSRTKVFSTASKNDLKAELLKKAWTSNSKDYFSLRIRLTNNSEATWVPEWSKIVLRQGTKELAHSGLSSPRSKLPPRAQITFEIQFTRPELSKNRGFLEIPAPQGHITLLVEKGISK